MTLRSISTGVLVATLALASMACALILGSAPKLVDRDYLQGDAFMATKGYRVWPWSPLQTPPIARVYVAGAGAARRPRVILLHELPGLRPDDVDLGLELAQHFEVYAPVLFGVAGQDSNRLGMAEACGHAFNCWGTGPDHPITASLTALVSALCADHDCGIVGMCLTGSLPLRLIETAKDANVAVLVMAQPSLPFLHTPWPFAPRVDISDDQVAKGLAVATARHAAVFLTRFRWDVISDHRVFEHLRDLIQRAKDAAPAGTLEFTHYEIPDNGHSTLVPDHAHAVESGEEFHRLLDALQSRLH